MERVSFELEGGRFAGAMVRYEVLGRMAECAARAGAAPIAFGLADRRVRLVVDGAPGTVTALLRGLKGGTRRALETAFGHGVVWTDNVRVPVTDVAASVAWCHRLPVEESGLDPLASPWSSHRDLMGYRAARFFDATPVRARVDPLQVHRLAGGPGTPAGWPPSTASPEALDLLLRIAGAVRGVLPSDRACFRLFVHLARARRWATTDTAAALRLTTRRVRQLGAEAEPGLSVALACLAHPALRIVP